MRLEEGSGECRIVPNSLQAGFDAVLQPALSPYPPRSARPPVPQYNYGSRDHCVARGL
jgi:hypothetical protein